MSHIFGPKMTKISRPCWFRASVTVHTRPLTSDDHNFLIRAPFGVFLDSMEISWSLESDHILFNGNWCSNPC